MTNELPPEATAAFNKVKLEITQEELAHMSDSSLALWQANETPEKAREHLAKYEWQRRVSERQMKERFALDQKLADGNRRWAIGGVVLGVTCTLLGGWLLKPTEGRAVPSPQATEALTKAPPQPPATGSTATSAANTTTVQPEKKPK